MEFICWFLQVLLVSKSNYIRRLILESKDTELARIDLSDMPGGPQIFEMAVKFCYGVDFEITVQNVAALWCAAEYLQMNEKYSENNLASRSESFLSEVALTSLSWAILVLKSCEDLLPVAEELNLVQRCVEIISAKVYDVDFLYLKKFDEINEGGALSSWSFMSIL